MSHIYFIGISLYMFRTVCLPLSGVRVHTATGVCHTDTADCLLANTSHPELQVYRGKRDSGFPESPGTADSRSHTEIRVFGVNRNSEFTESAGNPGSLRHPELRAPGVSRRIPGNPGSLSHHEIRDSKVKYSG